MGILAVALPGCKVNPTDPSLANSSAGTACTTPEAVISDNDDNDNQTNVIGGRGGYWYTFSDMEGTEVWPIQGAKGGTFEMTPGGAENSPYAARFKGKVAPTEGNTQAGMGLNFLDPEGPYDASAYGGISFWAKAGAGSATNVRVKISDINTAPDGGVCSECFNDFGMNISVGSEWQQYILRWGDLSQLPGWGKPRKMGITKSQLYAIQFQVNDKGANFDIWVDQIRFTGCTND